MLVQPDGKALRSVVRVRFVAALPSSVVKLTLTGCPVPTGAVGYPGQTGDALPGYTLTAPTRPSPVSWSASGAFSADSTHAIKTTVGGGQQ